MGCGQSAIAPEVETTKNMGETEKKESHVVDHNLTNGHTRALPPPPGGRKQSLQSHGKLQKQNSAVDKNANKLSAMDQTPVPKSISFDVSFGDESENPLIKRKPARLSTLEPLDLPKLTAEQLEEKQRIADEKRERIRQKKINKSQKSSKRRKDLLKAREFGLRQQMEQERSVIDDSIRQAEIKREQRLLEVKEKQKIREERAKRARERAKKMQNPDDEVEVEKDEQFNAASDESWLDNNPSSSEKENQRPQLEADEEEHLQKRISRQSNLRPTASASTVDSYDNAFMRTNTHEKVLLGDDDDFFGS